MTDPTPMSDDKPMGSTGDPSVGVDPPIDAVYDDSDDASVAS